MTSRNVIRHAHWALSVLAAGAGYSSLPPEAQAAVSATVVPGTLTQGTLKPSLTGGTYASESAHLDDWPLNTGGTSTVNNLMTFVGPDPDTGNLLGGLGLNFGTDTWHLGVHYDYLRGNNGSVSQVGTFTLLGRI